MMSVIVEAYEALRAAGCVTSQREFSTIALGCSPSYFSSMLARSEARTPSVQVLLTLYKWIRDYFSDSHTDFETQRLLSDLPERVWLAVMNRIHDKLPRN